MEERALAWGPGDSPGPAAERQGAGPSLLPGAGFLGVEVTVPTCPTRHLCARAARPGARRARLAALPRDLGHLARAAQWPSWENEVASEWPWSKAEPSRTRGGQPGPLRKDRMGAATSAQSLGVPGTWWQPEEERDPEASTPSRACCPRPRSDSPRAVRGRAGGPRPPALQRGRPLPWRGRHSQPPE